MQADGDQNPAQANKRRVARRGYLVFATDQALAPGDPGYREVFATEARTPNEAGKKVRPLADGRRLRVFLATGTYRTNWRTRAGSRRTNTTSQHDGGNLAKAAVWA